MTDEFTGFYVVPAFREDLFPGRTDFSTDTLSNTGLFPRDQFGGCVEVEKVAYLVGFLVTLEGGT